MTLMSWVFLGSFGLPRLKWLLESTAAVRHEGDCCPAAGHVPQHFHSRNPSAFMTPWCCSHLVQDELGGFASTVLNPWLCTGIAPLCIPEFVLLAASCLWLLVTELAGRVGNVSGCASPSKWASRWGPGGRAGLALCMLAVLCWGRVSWSWITAFLQVCPFQCAGAALCKVQSQDLKAVLATNSSAVLEWEWAVCSRLSWCGNNKQCPEKLLAWAEHCFSSGPKSKAGWSRAAKAVGECIAASQGKGWRSSQEVLPGRSLGWSCTAFPLAAIQVLWKMDASVVAFGLMARQKADTEIYH